VTGIGHYFITASATEAAAIDNGSAGPGWSRTGRTFQAWTDAANAAPGAVSVCRFYARVPNSHFYTADPGECQSLRAANPSNDPALGWAYEGVAFHTFVPQADGCASGTQPVYRSYNNRFSPNPALNDGNHRITPSYGDHLRQTRFLGYIDEGIAFCAPTSTGTGADLQATYSFPGTSAAASSGVLAEFVFGNNGPGSGDGGIVHAALPARIADWGVTCIAKNGASCPGNLGARALREGQRIATWPAGGTVTLLASGTVPQAATESDATLNFAATVSAASGSPDAIPANDTPPLAQTVFKAVAACPFVANPVGLSL
jgi:hypothetical protein